MMALWRVTIRYTLDGGAHDEHERTYHVDAATVATAIEKADEQGRPSNRVALEIGGVKADRVADCVLR